MSYRQNGCQKVFNWEILWFCWGALGLYGAAWHWIIDKNSTDYSVSCFNLGGLELRLGGFSPQKPNMATGLLKTFGKKNMASNQVSFLCNQSDLARPPTSTSNVGIDACFVIMLYTFQCIERLGGNLNAEPDVQNYLWMLVAHRIFSSAHISFTIQNSYAQSLKCKKKFAHSSFIAWSECATTFLHPCAKI